MLPFIKHRPPRLPVPNKPDHLVQASETDHIDHACIGELFNALESKDVDKLKQSLEALVVNMMDSMESSG